MKRFAATKKLRRTAREFLRRGARYCPGLDCFYVVRHIFPQQAVEPAGTIRKLRILAPEQQVRIARPEEDPFVAVGKYYRDGSFIRPPLFVCEVPEAILQVGLGMVCTHDFKMLADQEYRLPFTPPFGMRKPREMQRLAGTYSTIFYWNADNFGHWMFDCLPRIHLLSKAEPTAKLTLLMPEGMREAHQETLECLLPPNFEVMRYPRHVWLRLENFLWPSMVSGRCNFYLPVEYYEAIRRPVFARFGLPNRHRKALRLFITRRRAALRRVLNEAVVSELLARYGFESVELADLSLREQVELLHRADIVVGTHGAGLSSIVFSGDIRVVVLYPTQVPQNHYHTLAKGLGQEHHFLLHHAGEDDDFSVDVERLEVLLRSQLGLANSR